jgi:hypothetical protein
MFSSLQGLVRARLIHFVAPITFSDDYKLLPFPQNITMAAVPLTPKSHKASVFLIAVDPRNITPPPPGLARGYCALNAYNVLEIA